MLAYLYKQYLDYICSIQDKSSQ